MIEFILIIPLQYSSVLFSHSEGPTMLRNSPLEIVRLTSYSAVMDLLDFPVSA